MQSLHPQPGARYRSVTGALRQIVRTEGAWRPIRGVNVLAVGAGPAHALYFACYEKIKFSLSDAIHPGANSHFANGKTTPASAHTRPPRPGGSHGACVSCRSGGLRGHAAARRHHEPS